MKTILKYIILSGVRNKLYIGILFTLIISFSLAIFLGTTFLTEGAQTTAAFIAGLSRIVIIGGMILFTCLSVNRAFENKEIEFFLSKAISREKFILCFLCGFLISGLLILLPTLLAMSLIIKLNKIGLLFWSLNLLVELMIVICFSLLTSVILKNSFSAILASFSFYIISRLMGIFTMAIALPQDFSQAKNNFLTAILKIISIAFPRLDLFTQSQWIIYGIEDFSKIKIIALQSLIYIPLMIFMSFHDFKKKQF